MGFIKKSIIVFVLVLLFFVRLIIIRERFIKEQLSSIFEGLQWTNNLIFGLPVLIFGCVLILNQKSKKN